MPLGHLIALIINAHPKMGKMLSC